MRITFAINNLTSLVRNDLENESYLNRAYVRPVALTMWLLHDKVLVNVIPSLSAYGLYIIFGVKVLKLAFCQLLSTSIS